MDNANTISPPESADETRKCVSRTCVNNFYSNNHFVLKIGIVILLGKAYPPLGAKYVHSEITATWLAVIFIFTLAGLSLKTEEVKKSLTRVKFNLFVQTFNFFGVSSTVYYFTRWMLYLNALPTSLANGMIICSCMSITVTSVVVMTRIAEGDEGAAILNAAIGCLVGVFLTPALILWYIGVHQDIILSEVFLKLSIRVLLPFLTGQILQKTSTIVKNFVLVHKKKFKTCQEWALIFIVYTVFCKTFLSEVKATFTNIILLVVLQFSLIVFCMALAWVALRLLFRDEPRLCIMGFYGCTQKSVSVGIPLINAIYELDPNVGLYTLPLLIWHPTELLIGSALAPYLAQWASNAEKKLHQEIETV